METTAESKTVAKSCNLLNYETLANLFIYPENELYREKIKDAHAYLLSTFPEAAEKMQMFVEFTENSTLKEMQELFLRSFDVQAITTLDMGFVLFGEDYKRGQLLVHLNGEHRTAGNDCGVELSDHLPNVLRLLPKMKDEAMRNEIATRLVIPAIEKMKVEFSPGKIQKKDEVYKKHQKTVLDFSLQYRTVFQTVLQALLIVLKNDFNYKEEENTGIVKGCEEQAPCTCSTPGNDFKQNIETEMAVEHENMNT